MLQPGSFFRTDDGSEIECLRVTPGAYGLFVEGIFVRVPRGRVDCLIMPIQIKD